MRDLFYALGQLEYRDLDVRADVEDLPNRVRVIHQLDERANHVADVTKTAALFSIAINRDRTARNRLLHERRNDHAVLARLSRPDCVEETYDNGRKLLLAPVSKGEKLIDCF